MLERPEYGYATYFFELMDSFPINWQIRRLVTAMKLTSCSRVNLIENRMLMVFTLDAAILDFSYNASICMFLMQNFIKLLALGT